MRDFKQSNPDLIRAKILSDRMKYLKSTDEEVIKMCNIVEEYTAKKVAEASARSRDEGMQEGLRIANLNNIKSIMETQHLSAMEAMDALRIDKAQHKQYMALL